MKKLVGIVVLILVLLIPIRTTADDIFVEPTLIRCTCYAPTGNKAASGCECFEGIVASKKEYLGYTAILYDKDMRLIGFFEVRDTGGYYIRTGQRIDVYRDTLDRCYEWIDTYGDYVYVQLIDTKG